MKQLPTVFLSYNPDSERDETLAMRLHTLGAVNGFRMLLPDRYPNGRRISPETLRRINLADYFILFSTSPQQSPVVLEEINYAYEKWHDPRLILVIYDIEAGRNLKGSINCTEIYINSRRDSIPEITEKIQKQLRLLHQTTNSASSSATPLERIILAGLGIWLLDSLVNTE